MQKDGSTVNKGKTLIALHIMLMLYSVSGICSKIAGEYPFLSLKFCVFYSIVILLLGVYAIGWQQIIKRLPLSVAFANKAVTVIWGSVWGGLFFHETITFKTIVGATMVIIGVVMYACSDCECDDG